MPIGVMRLHQILSGMWDPIERGLNSPNTVIPADM